MNMHHARFIAITWVYLLASPFFGMRRERDAQQR
jgi:hypothetical protein